MSKPSLVYTTYIRSTPEKTWEAITKPEFTRRYWAGMANVSDWKAGSRWEHVTKTAEVWIEGEVVECVPSERLVMTWIDPEQPEDQSRVTFEIQRVDEDLVCLKVTHDQFQDESEMADKVAWGWPRVLSSMKSLLETGEGLRVFSRD